MLTKRIEVVDRRAKTDHGVQVHTALVTTWRLLGVVVYRSEHLLSI